MQRSSIFNAASFLVLMPLGGTFCAIVLLRSFPRNERKSFRKGGLSSSNEFASSMHTRFNSSSFINWSESTSKLVA